MKSIFQILPNPSAHFIKLLPDRCLPLCSISIWPRPHVSNPFRVSGGLLLTCLVGTLQCDRAFAQRPATSLPDLTPAAFPSESPSETPSAAPPDWLLNSPTTLPNQPSTIELPTEADRYTISAGDRVNVIISNVPEYSSTYQVLVDGTVDLPIIGSIYLQGMTTRDASTAIAQRYSQGEILVEPVVNVILAEANILNIAVIGEVNRPGAYAMMPNNGKFPTLAQAIDQAGGITQNADLQQIEIHRQSHPNAPEVIQVSLWKLLTEGDQSQNISLRDGDSIVLTTASAIAPEMAAITGTASFSPVAMQINVLGEVNQPGLLQVPPNTSLNQALMTAGGFTNRARRGSVQLVRLNPNGTVSSRRVDIDLTDDVNEDTNPMLSSRDVVIVGRSTLANISDTLGTILSPIGGAFSLFNLFSPFFAPSGQ